MAEGAEGDVPLRTARAASHMSIQVFQHIKDAIRNLDPEEIRKHTERPLRLLLYADNEQQYRDLEDYLLQRDLSAAKRAQVRRLIVRGSDGAVRSAPGDLEAVSQTLMAIRPYIRQFASGGALEALAT